MASSTVVIITPTPTPASVVDNQTERMSKLRKFADAYEISPLFNFKNAQVGGV